LPTRRPRRSPAVWRLDLSAIGLFGKPDIARPARRVALGDIIESAAATALTGDYRLRLVLLAVFTGAPFRLGGTKVHF
jgi:hypothetical protein